MARRRVAVEFVAELSKFRRGTRDAADDVRKLKDESKAAQAEVGKLGKVGEGAGKQLGDGIVRGADGRLRDARGRFIKAGETSGKDYGDGFKRGAGRSLAGFAGGAFGVVGDLGAGASRSTMIGLAAIPAASAAASASLQAIPPLLATIGGGLGAIPGLAAGAAGSIGTLKLATAGLGDAIEDVFATPAGADPYTQLSRSGKRFVDSLAAQKRALLGLRSLAQDQVFAGLDAEIDALARTALPFATRQVIRFGSTWNQTLKQAARVGRDPQFLAGVDAAFGSADRFFDNVNARIPGTARSLAHLFTSSVPFVDRFGDSLLSYVDDFNAWINGAAASGKLDGFFRDAAEQADALLDVGKEVLVLVGRIGGMQQGSTLLRDMADALQRFNDEAHNMRSVEGIVATGNAAIKGLVDVLVILGEAMGQTLADPGTRDAVVLFFDVLAVGAQVIGDLARLFGLLPDGIQSAVLAGFALALVWGRLQSVGGRFMDVVGRANDRMRETGPAGERAANGLDRFGRALRVAGALAVGLQLGSIFLGQFSDAEIKTRRLSKSLEELGKTGQRTGELQRILGNDFESTSKYFAAASRGAYQNTLRFAESIPIYGDFQKSFSEAFHGASFTAARDNIAKLDSELATFADTTDDAGVAQAAYTRLLQQSGLDAGEFAKLMPESNAALRDAASSTRGANLEQRLLIGTMEDAIGTAETFTRVWAELNGETLNSDQAMLAAREAIKGVAESFRENGKSIKGNSTAALENRIAVGEAAKAAAESAQAKFEETGSVQAANKVYADHIGQLRKTLAAAGLLPAEIEAIIGKYAAMPRDVTTTITAKTAQAEANLRHVKALSDLIKSKRVVITTVHNTVVTRSEGRNVGIGDGVGGRRWGGIDYAMARGGAIEAHWVTSPTVLYGERATGGEAFIPKRGDRERSVTIGRRAMEWYGMDVVPKTGPRSVMLSGQAAAAPATASYPETQIIENHIEIGGEVVRVVRTEISDSNRELKRRTTAGAGAGR